jgi:hypothetical protein
LATAKEKAVSLLKLRLQEKEKPDRIRKLISNLDDDSPEIRQRSHDELERLGHEVEAYLAKALQESSSPELRHRATALLAALESPWPKSAQTLRRIRAVQVLERVGSDEARELLRSMCEQAPSERERQEARASLDRLEGRR